VADVGEAERESEARWIGEAMRDAGRRADDRDVLDILRLHEAYLAASPPDDVWADADELGPAEDGADDDRWIPVGVAREERRTMAHPIRPDRADQEGGPA
jgi:hypothetical protein